MISDGGAEGGINGAGTAGSNRIWHHQDIRLAKILNLGIAFCHEY